MDLSDSPAEAAVRAEARAWLDEHWPRFTAEHGTGRYDTERMRAWHRMLHAGGWAAPSWPVEYGGRGFDFAQSTVWAQEKARAGANLPFNVPGFGMAGPTIIAHGTDAQRQRYLPTLLSGDELWCQLFSEPGAGSDLASVATRAIQDGSDWVVSGQKVWSSAAHEADFGILLARHDFELPKHKGLIYFLLDMRAPGIDVRPLRQMDGGAHFNEVFLNDVRVLDTHRVGEPGDGWAVAMTTLMNERVSLGGAMSGFEFPFDRLVAIAKGRPAGPDKKARAALARVYTRKKILEFLNHRMVSTIARGGVPAAEGSIMKLILANLVSDSAEVGVDLLGPDGMLEAEGIQHAFLGGLAFHLGGGTDEVQRNVIGERVLGLPRDDQPGRDLPFESTMGARA
jgi:alkylation response protein AidB-like acyl-CoA dehydrogenase